MDRRSENCGAWCLGRGITSLPDVWSPSSVGACNHYSNIWSLCHFKGILDLLHLYIPISETHSKACPTLQVSKPYTVHILFSLPYKFVYSLISLLWTFNVINIRIGCNLKCTSETPNKSIIYSSDQGMFIIIPMLHKIWISPNFSYVSY